MKTLYLIGRESECDVVLWSNSPEISRRHAQIRMDQKGQYWLMDTSLNGTYLNGMRLQPNQEVMVTRKDVISFALQETLDWSLIPKKSKKGLWITLSVVVLLLAAASVLAVLYWPKGDSEVIVEMPATELSEQTEKYVDENPTVDTAVTKEQIKVEKPAEKENLKTIKVKPPKNASKKDKSNPAEEVYEQVNKKKAKTNDSATKSSTPVNKEVERKPVKPIEEQTQVEQQPTDAIF